MTLAGMRKPADAEDIRHIALPRIGVGYGGLSWAAMRAVQRVFDDWSGIVVVYEGFVSDAPEPQG